MVCGVCGQPLGATGRCTTCGTSAQTFVVTAAPGQDTTGLPPGATFAATTGRGQPVTAPRPAGPLHVGQSFGPRYHIIKLLGAGGMGAVYQAWDAELSVAVALKVIRPDPRAGAPSKADEKRFKHELLLARQVTHKNVVRIHDLGEIDGIKYITMPFIQGEDLATTLRRDKALPVGMAMQIARQVAAGLDAAHDAGVVHRDLKPANVMITVTEEGIHAEIMDFGISVSSSESTAEGVIGTLEYMAPEQGEGSAVDGRADIYAFGLIVYEMLTGPRSFVARTPQERLAAMRQRCQDGLPPIAEVDPSIPGPLAQLVTRCLERDPASRFQISRELCAALDALNDDGHLRPQARYLTRRLMLAAAVLVTAMLAGTYAVTRRVMTPPKAHDPVAVVIADFDNQTGDPAFTRTLEPTMKRALEGAAFINAYDRNGLSRTLGVRPPDAMTEAAARSLAVKQGLGVVLSGAITRKGSGYALDVKAVESVSGKVIARASRTAARKEDVVADATRLAAAVRTGLGDDASESSQLFAMQSVSTTSLDVVRLYAAAQEAASSNRFEEARQQALKAVTLDPKFGTGYQVLAVASRNMGDLQDALKYSTTALRYLDGMTDRERLSTRGFYYRMTGDYQQCVKEYGDLIARYAADLVGHNQLALCQSKLRNMRDAVKEMQQTLRILPTRALFRDNLALYSDYAGDFASGEQQARRVGDTDAYATLAIAFAQVGQGDMTQAAETYRRLAGLNALGESLSASGLGDLAAVQGRYGEAIRILGAGAARDAAAGNPDRSAAKIVAMANAELSRGHQAAAIAAARRALAGTTALETRFLAARILAQAGDVMTAKSIADSLTAELQVEPRAYGKIVAGSIALAGGNAVAAVTLLTDANGLLDTWMGHFDLGRAYLAAHALAEADSEFDRTIKRRGEALAVLVDEQPTFSYFPPAYYYQGRVRQGLQSEGFADAYRQYLAFRGTSNEDPLASEVRTVIAK